MAERAYETPHHFLEFIVEPNYSFFRENQNSLQASFNIIMSLDALVGHMHIWLKEHGEPTIHTFKDDAEYRNSLANENSEFELVRDLAKALKHFELTRGNPRIIRADQASLAPTPVGRFRCGDMLGQHELLLQTSDGPSYWGADIVDNAIVFVRSKLQELPSP